MRRFIGIWLAVAILAGCGGAAQTGTQPLLSTGLQEQMKLQPGDGGAFSASYKGTIRGRHCRLGHEEDIVFDGQGEASFLHQSREHAILLMTQGPTDCDPVEADFDLFSNNPNDSIWGLVRFSQDGDGKGRYKILGGYGRFAKATGSGTWSFTLMGDHYEDAWTGTLTF